MENMCYLLVLLLLMCTISFLMYFYFPYWKLRKIPGPPTAFLVGHLHLLAKYGPNVLRAFSKEYGPIFRFHLGRQPLVIVADPELCREVCIKKFKDIKNRKIRSPTSGSPLHEQGLFLSRDSRWSQMRNTIISLYQPTHLATLIPTMKSHVQTLVSIISSYKENEDIDISELTTKLAINIIGETAFGVQFNLLNGKESNEEISSFLKLHTHSIDSLKMDLNSSLSTVLGFFFPAIQNPCCKILKSIPGTADYKMHDTNKKLCKIIDAMIEKRSREKTSESKDFLATVINARDQNGGKDLFSDDYIRALVYEHLLAGTKTSAFTIAMTVYLVSKHPEVEKKLLEEIDRVVSKDQTPDAYDLEFKFLYLDQVVKESMRFFTVSPLVAREISKQVEIGGYTLPKGTWVWLALGVLAKDSKQFSDPDAFRPERFDKQCDEQKKRHACSHIPFGIGPRACIGQKFAVQEVKLALIQLYQRYTFMHSPNMESPLAFEYGLVLGLKHGVKVRAIKRHG